MFGWIASSDRATGSRGRREAAAAAPADLPALLRARPERGPLGLRLDAAAVTPPAALGALDAERVARHVLLARHALRVEDSFLASLCILPCLSLLDN